MGKWFLHLFVHLWRYAKNHRFRVCKYCGRKETMYGDHFGHWWMECK